MAARRTPPEPEPPESLPDPLTSTPPPLEQPASAARDRARPGIRDSRVVLRTMCLSPYFNGMKLFQHTCRAQSAVNGPGVAGRTSRQKDGGVTAPSSRAVAPESLAYQCGTCAS